MNAKQLWDQILEVSIPWSEFGWFGLSVGAGLNCVLFSFNSLVGIRLVWTALHPIPWRANSKFQFLGRNSVGLDPRGGSGVDSVV